MFQHLVATQLCRLEGIDHLRQFGFALREHHQCAALGITGQAIRRLLRGLYCVFQLAVDTRKTLAQADDGLLGLTAGVLYLPGPNGYGLKAHGLQAIGGGSGTGGLVLAQTAVMDVAQRLVEQLVLPADNPGAGTTAAGEQDQGGRHLRCR
ncbi:hypothetical protein D3C84_742790 [compost metagenome]